MLLTAWAYFYRQLENRYLQTGKLIFPSCTINILLYKNRVYNRNVELIGKREKPYQVKEDGAESVY
jgi:hypothetical protein